MKFLLQLSLFLSLNLCLLHAYSPGPLHIQPASTWSMEFKEEKNIPNYSIYKKKSEHPSLTISAWPLPGSEAEVPQYFESMIRQFLGDAANDPQNQMVDSSYSTKSLKGDSISGEMVTFTLTNGLIKALAMFSDGERIWSTQYHGLEAEWNEALPFIRKIKRK